MADKCTTVSGFNNQFLYLIIVYICTQPTVWSVGWNVIGLLRVEPGQKHINSLI